MLDCENPHLLYETSAANSLLHVLLIGLQNVADALHQLLDLGGQTLSRRLLQDLPDQLLCVPVALVVHQGRRPGPAGCSVGAAPAERDLGLGLGQRGLRCLGGRVGGPEGVGEGSGAAALLCRGEKNNEKKYIKKKTSPLSE